MEKQVEKKMENMTGRKKATEKEKQLQEKVGKQVEKEEEIGKIWSEEEKRWRENTRQER